MKQWLRGHKKLTTLILLAVALLISNVGYSIAAPKTKLQPAQTTVKPISVSDIDPGEIISLTNEDRATAGISPVTEDSVLNTTATSRCTDMATKGYYSHTSPDGTPWYNTIKALTSYSAAGENIAAFFSEGSADKVNAEWMNSPEHKANILNAKFTNIGVAVCEGTYLAHPTVFAVEHFDTPAAATKPFSNPNPRNLPLCPQYNTDPFWNPTPGLDCF